jgi:hypothetical protein
MAGENIAIEGRAGRGPDLVKSRPDPMDAEALDRATSLALRGGDLQAAAASAEAEACLHRASRWYPPAPTRPAPRIPKPRPMLSRGKLHHDIEQYRYLLERGVLPSVLPRLIAGYEKVLSGLAQGQRRELNEDERDLIGEAYGRIVWKPSTPRQAAALSSSWDRDRVQAAYRDHPVGIVVIDNVLTPTAFECLRRFCVESTIWFENRYAYGRLGSFFREGFNCPLLIQIAEEFRAAVPRIIDGHPLQQLWAFKNEPHQPTTLPHADFAAVNVNFWMTPEQANMDAATGGMIIYDVPTPPDWDFTKYNTRGDVIARYLLEKEARSVRIPYRANRAIVFNSKYFHKTDALDFSPRFEDRRVNVTLLFGRHGGASRG